MARPTNTELRLRTALATGVLAAMLSASPLPLDARAADDAGSRDADLRGVHSPAEPDTRSGFDVDFGNLDFWRAATGVPLRDQSCPRLPRRSTR